MEVLSNEEKSFCVCRGEQCDTQIRFTKSNLRAEKYYRIWRVYATGCVGCNICDEKR